MKPFDWSTPVTIVRDMSRSQRDAACGQLLAGWGREDAEEALIATAEADAGLELMREEEKVMLIAEEAERLADALQSCQDIVTRILQIARPL